MKELSGEFLNIIKDNERFLNAYPVFYKYPVEFAIKVGNSQMFKQNINKMLKL